MQTFQSKFSTYISPSANDADITRSDLRSATAGWNGAYLTRRRFVRRTRAEGCDRSDNPSRRENGENRHRIQYDAGSVKEGSKRTGIFQKFADVTIVHFQKTSNHNKSGIFLLRKREWENRFSGSARIRKTIAARCIQSF